MGFFSKLFGRKGDEEQQKAGGMEDFMTLIRVYFQAVMASDLGITNMAALPDLRVFKATLHVPTQNNKLGLAEKSRCKKMLKEIYGMGDDFTKEKEAPSVGNDEIGVFAYPAQSCLISPIAVEHGNGVATDFMLAFYQ